MRQIPWIKGDVFNIAKSSLLFAQEKPAAVIVQGDTSTTHLLQSVRTTTGYQLLMSKQVLRTGNLLSPHLGNNRKIISQVAKWHFTPTKTATENLIKEGVEEASIHQVGNTVIDALKYVFQQLEDDLDFKNNFFRRDKYGCI